VFTGPSDDEDDGVAVASAALWISVTIAAMVTAVQLPGSVMVCVMVFEIGWVDT
jgi:hypothetical protein